MKALLGGYLSKEAPENEAESTSSDSPGVSSLSLQNVRRNLGNAYNSIAYGKWRRKDDILEDCNSQIWVLGRWYLPQGQGSPYEEDCPMFYHDYYSKIWLTYRRDFSPLGGTTKTTDCGWGCMVRSAQMMVAQALTVLHLRRAYRLSEKTHEEIRSIIRIFEDKPEAHLGIHKLMELAGDSAIGEWFTPSRAMALLRDAILKSDHEYLKNLRIYLSADNCIILNEIKELSESWTKAVILVICVRLGTKKINDCYKHHVKSVLSFESSVGAIGGRPKHSVYFIGFHGDTLFHLDPHIAQKYLPLDSDEEKTWKTFHCRKPTRMKVDDMDPSCALGFLIRNEEEFKNLLKQLADSGIVECSELAGVTLKKHLKSPNALFSVMEERISPEHLVNDTWGSDNVEEELHGFEVV
ncbi:hypothetical protein FO519_003126 [Halicephalobus sp. NKZ332]|nr:hypothetical protein FO519_003126 [Halicephalobus sp. NKZ332]